VGLFLGMPRKKPVATVPFDPRRITMDQLIEIFSTWKGQRQAELASIPKGIPAVPYKVEDVPPTSPSEVAHFRFHFREPDRIEGKISFVMPDRLKKRGKAKTKKAKWQQMIATWLLGFFWCL
jgi:hypothetical protein